MPESVSAPSSPPPEPAVPGEPDALDEARRQLAELATVLRERFDRTTWQEYLRLRRQARR
jgi:hypothetical protein